MIAGRQIGTPFGLLTVVVSGEAVVSSGFRSLRVGESLAGVPNAVLDEVEQALEEWVSGTDLAALDRIPVVLPTSGFRADVWRVMRGIPPGSVASYGQLAGAAGRPGAARAAGTACATNPVAPFVPCHRVVRSDGSLGEYGYGPDIKRALLEHEGAI